MVGATQSKMCGGGAVADGRQQLGVGGAANKLELRVLSQGNGRPAAERAGGALPEPCCGPQSLLRSLGSWQLVDHVIYCDPAYSYRQERLLERQERTCSLALLGADRLDACEADKYCVFTRQTRFNQNKRNSHRRKVILSGMLATAGAAPPTRCTTPSLMCPGLAVVRRPSVGVPPGSPGIPRRTAACSEDTSISLSSLYSPSQQQQEEEQMQRLTLRDGRQLVYTWFGVPQPQHYAAATAASLVGRAPPPPPPVPAPGQGSRPRVVLTLHGFLSSRLEGGLLHEDALHHGLSLLAVDRPGSGGSTHNPSQVGAV